MYCIGVEESKRFFYVEICDKIKHPEIIEFLDVICSTQKVKKDLLLITDYRNAVIDEITIAPIEKIGLFVNTMMKSKFNHIRWANVSTNHLPTTGAIILYEIIKDKNTVYKPFTTIDTALTWLNLSRNDYNNLVLLKKSI